MREKKECACKVIIPCPECGLLDYVGFLGGGRCKRYFCSDCCAEFIIREAKTDIYYFDKDGVLEK
jgi:transposase-like protein